MYENLIFVYKAFPKNVCNIWTKDPHMYIYFKSKNCVHFFFFYLEQTWYKSYLVIDIQEIILNEFKINILLTTILKQFWILIKMLMNKLQWFDINLAFACPWISGVKAEVPSYVNSQIYFFGVLQKLVVLFLWILVS